jgi:hypothetical protein
MAKYSKDTYQRMFDQLLSAELSYNSAFASEQNIRAAIKKVLGCAVKTNCILLYYDLTVLPNLDVSFKIVDPDKDIIHITLFYGA